METLHQRLNDGALFLAIASGGLTIGAVSAAVRACGLRLDRLAAVPEARRRGVAATLVAAVEGFAAKIGAARVSLGDTH